MAANNETRIYKNNTIEELRQKANEVSLHLGDNKLLDTLIADKTVEFNATAGQTIFSSNSVRFEIKPDESIDDVSNGESLNVGVVKVYSDGTELDQGLGSDEFKVPNFSFLVNLQNSPTIPAEFIEGAVLTQSGGFSGTLLSADSDVLRFKSTSGTFSAAQNLGIPHTDPTKRVNSADILSSSGQDPAFGNIIELNTAATGGEVIKIVSTNVIDAINEIQDDVGDISTLDSDIPLTPDVVGAINSFKGEVGNAVDLTTSASVVVGAINEHESDIGDMSLTTTATNLTDAINEHDSELGTISSAAFGTTASTVSTAIAELHTDVDARLKLTSGTEQTLNSDIQFTSGNTLEFPAGTTLDIRNGLLQTGAGGFQITTGFIDFNADIAERGLSFERSNFGNGADVKLYWDETYAATQPDRGFRIDGLNTGSTTETADLVTFYNAQDLIANNTETGISVTWDSVNQNFDFALTADPTISLAGDLSGSVALTNLATSTFTLTATIGSGVVENDMLAGSIDASKLAGSIPNNKLSNSSITISDGTNTSPIALGGTLELNGTSGEVEVVENAGTVTIGLPSNVTIGNNLIVTGDLTVNGTNTILNTTTLEVEDTLILTGTTSTEPTTGGFGIETQSFTGVGTHANAASNVTGSHSLVYNFATDQWEADGNVILDSVNSLITPQVKVNNGSTLAETDLTGTRDLDFIEGTGIDIAGALNSTDIDITITNTDRGSSQNIFKNVASDSGTAVADNNNDTLTITGGNNLSTSVSADTVTVQHDNSGVTAASYGSQFVVPSITVDARGHVTAASSNSAITLSALGYSGSTNADNYGSFSIRANTGTTTAIGSGETITFQQGGATAISRSGNTITISSTNTTYSVGDGGLTQVNFTTARRDKLNGIESNANNFNFNVSHNGGSGSNFGDGGTLNISQSTGITVSRSGNSYTITNSSPNVTTNLSATQSGNTFRVNSSDGNNATFATATTSNCGPMSTGDKSKLDGIAAGATNVTNNNQISNGAGYVTSSGVTSVGTSNGLTGGTITSTGTIQMSGSYSGTFTATEVCATSDERLKDNIETLDGNKVFDMRGVSFTMDEKESSGMIAQELEKIAPELVHEGDDGYKSIAYGNTVGYLIEAIKLLKDEIEELKSINNKV